MQSRFFRTTGVESEELEKDLRALQRLEAEQLLALQRFLSEGEHLVQRDESMEREIDQFLRKGRIAAEQYARARRLTLFFVEACDRYDDQPSAIIDDLNTIVPLGTDLRSFFTGLAEAVLRAVQARRRDRLAKRSVPALTGISYSCDVRVDMPEFDVFRDDPDNRAATPRDWVPIALIRFSTDEKDDLPCQVDLEHLQRAISVLRAAEQDLLLVREKLAAAGLSGSVQSQK